MPEAGAVPGAVIAIQSFSDFMGFNPHLHVLGTDGCFQGDGPSEAGSVTMGTGHTAARARHDLRRGGSHRSLQEDV